MTDWVAACAKARTHRPVSPPKVQVALDAWTYKNGEQDKVYYKVKVLIARAIDPLIRWPARVNSILHACVGVLINNTEFFKSGGWKIDYASHQQYG